MRIAILDVNARARLDAFSSVIAVIRHIAGAILDEVVLGIETPTRDRSASGIKKIFSFVLRHIEIDSFEKATADKTPTQIAQHRIARMLPLFHMKDDIRIVHFQMLGDVQSLTTQHLFKRRSGRTPNRGAFFNQLQRSQQRRSQNSFCRTQGPMKINLPKHVVARLQILFDRKDTTGRHINAIALLIDLERIDDPLQVVETILRSSHQRVA